MADEDAPEHTDEFYSILFIAGLNTNYSEYTSTFKKNKVRSWPQTMADANQDAANFLMGRPVHKRAPPYSEKRNVFAAGRGGRAGSAGRGGRGRGSSQGAEKGGYDTPGSESTARAGTPYRDRDATPQRERGGTVQEYGTRYGTCNNCGEEGHYAYECKKPPRKNAPARHPSSEK